MSIFIKIIITLLFSILLVGAYIAEGVAVVIPDKPSICICCEEEL